MMKSYFNTVAETGIELETSERKASAQEKIILRIFMGINLTAAEQI